jgi:hypothetical protein
MCGECQGGVRGLFWTFIPAILWSKIVEICTLASFLLRFELDASKIQTSYNYFIIPMLRVKGKVVPVLLTEHHVMKAYWRSGGIAPRILNLVTRWRWVVSFTPRYFAPRERSPGTDWLGGWVGPRAGLDTVVKIKIPSLCRDSNPHSFSP